MPFIDISRPVSPGMAVWPGDTPFQIQATMSQSKGDTVNVSQLTMSSHSGTHVDAPFHVRNDGAKIDQLDPEIYWGSAQVVTINKGSGPILPSDLAAYDLSLAPRILVRSPLSALSATVFPDDCPYPDPTLVDVLAANGIRLYGTDAPSVDAIASKTLPAHQALLSHHILILEGLDLSEVPDGIYELVALPLRLTDGDGSPVRAVLRYEN